MTPHNYILMSNSKAIAHFNSLGIKLTPATKAYYADTSSYIYSFGHYANINDMDYGCAYTNDIYVVDMPLSGSQFHKYLKDNNLLNK